MRGRRLALLSAKERTMKVGEVIEKAIRGELRWFDAAGILGISDRQMRRWRARYQKDGPSGLTDGRQGKPPANRVSEETVRQVVELYRTSYPGFNAQHFWEQLVEEHELKVSYMS
jgi:transposase